MCLRTQVVMAFANFEVRTIITADSMNVSGDAVFVGDDTGERFVRFIVIMPEKIDTDSVQVKTFAQIASHLYFWLFKYCFDGNIFTYSFRVGYGMLRHLQLMPV